MIKCRVCEADLEVEGLGVISKIYQIDYGNSKSRIEYGDAIGYYCPNCGSDLDSSYADKFEKHKVKLNDSSF